MKTELVQFRADKDLLFYLRYKAKELHLPVATLARLWVGERVKEEKLLSSGDGLWNNSMQEAIKRLEEHLADGVVDPIPVKFDCRDRAALRFVLDFVKIKRTDKELT